MQEVVLKYMERVQQKSYVPQFSYGRGLLRDDGGPNRLFLTYMFATFGAWLCMVLKHGRFGQQIRNT
jgi:hypothetical protein